MADYSDWDEERIKPEALLLDSENPRIPPAVDHRLSQRELIADLVAHDRVYELARDITRIGYLPVESIVVTEDGGQTIVLEGNRRVAALKLLNDPMLAPRHEVNRFKRLSSLPTLALPDKVRVLLAPTRDAAALLILSKHTRDQVDRWSPLQQARFYRSLVQSLGSPEEVSKAYGATVPTILEALRLESMYEVAQAAELSDEIRKKVNDPRAFPASVLARLLEVGTFKDFLGVRFDSLGRVFTKVKPHHFGVAYARVLTDIVSG